MTKRAPGKFERVERDFYRTPPEAVGKLQPWIRREGTFAEPMCGDGAIIHALERYGWRCGWASDIEPRMENYHAQTLDVLDLTAADIGNCSVVISNPPWPRPGKAGEPTISIILHLMRLKRTWLLLSADFAHNVYARQVLHKCRRIVSVGRVSWMQNKTSGLDNCAWYLFDPTVTSEETIFSNTGLTKSYRYGMLDDLF